MPPPTLLGSDGIIKQGVAHGT